MGHEPWAVGHEPWAVNRGPWAVSPGAVRRAARTPTICQEASNWLTGQALKPPLFFSCSHLASLIFKRRMTLLGKIWD
ncbi:hypothetical protein FJTKL_08962 [Diaporthe vaccinii]|uniref:Uncharacterized protein n=1 Tax=Diaporthe vaccinii TaxID=105482 RepID=A0ABR4DP42_9PEZI